VGNEGNHRALGATQQCANFFLVADHFFFLGVASSSTTGAGALALRAWRLSVSLRLTTRVSSELAGDLLGFEVGELVGQRDAWKVLDLPSVAGAGERDAETHVA